MIILVDIDNTITNMNHIWLKYINNEYKTSYKYSDITHWGFFNELEAQGKDVFSFLHIPQFWKDITVYPNAVFALEHWAKRGHQVYLATASDIFSPSFHIKMEQTLKPFSSHLINQNNIIVTNNKELINGDVLIDDKLETIEKWVKLGKMGFIPDQPWNRNYEAKPYCNQFTLFDWKDDLNERWETMIDIF